MSTTPSLSERQKACLLLVARGMSSKEIAQEIGLSPRSVDTYLTDAMAVLGASNRREAARIFLQLDTSQNLQSQSQPLAAVPEPAKTKSWSGWKRARDYLLPIPVGGTLNNLSVTEKSVYAFRIGATGVIILLAILTTFIGLLTVF